MGRGRNLYETRMLLNPEKKAELLVKSPYRQHQKAAAALAELGMKAAQKMDLSATVNTDGEVQDIQQGPL